ncbi:MAG: MucB/RseB C-terminal domain-containing protein [Steroidobacteraceae bacterium]
MLRRATSSLFLCCLLALPAHAAEPDAKQWLERMTRALAEQNYEGFFFHVRGARSERMRIIHRVDRGQVSERLVSLDGSGREIIRNASEVICYLPDRRTVLVEKRSERTDATSLLGGLPSYSESLETLYDISKIGGVVKTLGRKTQVVWVQPRDQYRYGYRLWLDQETALPLKSQLCDRQGRVIEQILFSEVNLRERIAAADLKPAVSGEGYTWLRQTTQPVVVAGMTVGWSVIRLPAGFKLTERRVQAIAGSNTPVRHLVFSDGLATVSVFIEPRDTQAEPMHGLKRVGAAFAYSRDLDGHQVTAVGEVPAATVEAIAAGVMRDEGDEPPADSATPAAPAVSPP